MADRLSVIIDHEEVALRMGKEDHHRETGLRGSFYVVAVCHNDPTYVHPLCEREGAELGQNMVYTLSGLFGPTSVPPPGAAPRAIVSADTYTLTSPRPPASSELESDNLSLRPLS